MCNNCLKNPSLLSGGVKINESRRIVNSIRGSKDNIFFNRIYYDVIKPNTSWYWHNTNDIEVMSVCLKRSIDNNKILWNYVYDDVELIQTGNILLDKFLKLKVFL